MVGVGVERRALQCPDHFTDLSAAHYSRHPSAGGTAVHDYFPHPVLSAGGDFRAGGDLPVAPVL